MSTETVSGALPAPAKKLGLADLTTKELPTWCLACGDFNILYGIKQAMVDLQLSPENTLIVSGIGCGSKTPHFIRAYGFEGLHGRPVPVATGAKLANKDLTVIVVAGDGDTYGIGANHLLQAMRRNLDITVIVQNNEVYGLTKGQYSPTSTKGFKSSSTPAGSVEEPLNPMLLGISAGATYVARGYSYEVMHLKKLIVEGVRHKGFSLIDCFQPCSTYNKINTIDWYKQHLYKLEDAGHNPGNVGQALAKAMEWGEKIPIGLFFRYLRPTYEDSIEQKMPLWQQPIDNVDISAMLAKFG
ncbi:MAG: 2-oxoacid:ferredoxin oxidoreductase subunit beta [Candidatus Aenigmarchaeota archaeon]|nr:2-oxoacid:ferredoxin oxidoreductase subunit beta [Candidatus Aenigmarchaeota archaeon]